MQSQVKFDSAPKKAPKKVPEKVPGGFGAEPGQVQQGSEEGSGEGSGRLSCRFRRRWEALVQSLVRFNRGPSCTKKPPGTFSGNFSGTLLNLAWICTKASQTGFRRRFQGLGGFGAARSGSTGFRRRFQRLASQHASERFVKTKRCGCWGYH